MSSKKSPPNEAAQIRAYTFLSWLFDKYQQTRAQGSLTIEILPPGLEPPEGQPVFEDNAERSIGVPKKVLVAAFLHARRVFLERARNGLDNAIEYANILLEATLSATRVILLFDPEYVTAANYRKQHLLTIRDTAVTKNDDSLDTSLGEAIQSEIWFLNCVLTSPLHRQSKSPTLWYHRYWVYNTLQKLPTEQIDAVTKEFDVIFKAAEQHPHNYYAFQYARRLLLPAINNATNDDEAVKKQAMARNDALIEATGNESIFLPLLDRASNWCKRHPSDTSGWSFLLFMMRTLHMHATNEKLAQAVLKFAVDIGWKGESLWHFLRTVTNSVGVFSTSPGDQLNSKIRESIVKLAPFQDQLTAPSDQTPSG